MIGKYSFFNLPYSLKMRKFVNKDKIKMKQNMQKCLFSLWILSFVLFSVLQHGVTFHMLSTI